MNQHFTEFWPGCLIEAIFNVRQFVAWFSCSIYDNVSSNDKLDKQSYTRQLNVQSASIVTPQ